MQRTRDWWRRLTKSQRSLLVRLEHAGSMRIKRCVKPGICSFCLNGRDCGPPLHLCPVCRGIRDGLIILANNEY